MTPEEHRVVTRLCVLACRIAFREVAPAQKVVREDIARRLQETWEDDGINLCSIEDVIDYYGEDVDGDDAIAEMRRVYKKRKGRS